MLQSRVIACLLALVWLVCPVWAAPVPGISDAWVRALPPTQSNTAAYLTFTNRGSEALRIIGASAELAARAQIHTTREVDGMLRMEQVSQIEVAPGEQVELAPGGMHLMLLDLARMPVTGDVVRLCLLLAEGAPECVDAPVRRGPTVGDGEAHQHHGQH